jgi:hypothetical protein
MWWDHFEPGSQKIVPKKNKSSDALNEYASGSKEEMGIKEF